MAKYNLAVIGAGQGGLPAAFMAARLGAKVALIEMREVGGTCLNEGCIPTKTLLRSAEVMHLVKERAHEFGVRGVEPQKVRFDLPSQIIRKNEVVGGIVGSIHKRLERNEYIDYVIGQAELITPDEIKVDGKSLQVDKMLLAVGARPIIPEIPGINTVGYLTNREALDLEELPKSMIIVGTGYVGVEFAQMYARFGTKVTLIGKANRILPTEEQELSGLLAQILEDEGISIHLDTEVVETGTERGIRYVTAITGEKKQRFTAEQILMATGRTARIGDLGLDNVGVELNGRFIETNQQLRTAAANIWSIGDANGGAMFTHRAIYDGTRAALNAIKGARKTVDYRVVPRAVFTQPALASVGLTEEQAKQAGHNALIGRSYFTASGRAKGIREINGMLKVIVAKESGEILGAHILGEHADVLIHEIVVAMYGHGKIDSLQKSIHIHPTLSEMVQDVAKAAR